MQEGQTAPVVRFLRGRNTILSCSYKHSILSGSMQSCRVPDAGGSDRSCCSIPSRIAMLFIVWVQTFRLFNINAGAVGTRRRRGRRLLNNRSLISCNLNPTSVNQVCKQSVSQLGLKPGAFGRHYHSAVGNVEQLLNTYRV